MEEESSTNGARFQLPWTLYFYIPVSGGGHFQGLRVRCELCFCALVIHTNEISFASVSWIFSISLFVTMNLYHFQSLFVWLFVFSHTTLFTLQNTPWILCLCLDYVTKSSKQQYSQTLTNKFLAFPVFMCSNYLRVSSRKRPSNSYIPSGRYFTNHSHKMLKVVTTGQMVGQTVSAYIICNYLTDWPARQVNS